MFWSKPSSKPVPLEQKASPTDAVFQGASRGAKSPSGHPAPLSPVRALPRSSNVLGRQTPYLEPEDDVHPSKPLVWMGHGDRTDVLPVDAQRFRQQLRRVMLELEDQLTSLFFLPTSSTVQEHVNGTLDRSGGPESILTSDEPCRRPASRKTGSIQWGEELRVSSNSNEEQEGNVVADSAEKLLASEDLDNRSQGSEGEWGVSEEHDHHVARAQSQTSLMTTMTTVVEEEVEVAPLGPTTELSVNERALHKVWKAWRAVVAANMRRTKTTESRARQSSDWRSTIKRNSSRYDLHVFWKDAAENQRRSKKSNIVQRPSANSFTSGGGGKTMKIKRMDKAMTDYARRNRFFLMFIINPLSPRRMCWELFGIFMIVYDMIAIPLQVFDTPWDDMSTVMTWIVVCYWTLDIPGSFLVGFHVDGVLELRIGKMVWHYVSTWFIPDILVITFDWILLISDMQDSNKVDHMSYVKAGRSLRLLRFLRLIRLLKLRGVLTKILELIHSDYVLTLLRVLKLLLFIVMINHFVACAWYGIGEENSDSWVYGKFDQDHGFGYRYATSLHWSFTQFTPASMEVVPTNFGERLFAVCVIIVALVAFSSFVSSITEAMTRLRNLNSQRTEQQSQLRRYFGENRIPPQVQTRVWRFLERAAVSERRKRQMWQDVALVKRLPDILQMELKTEAYNPTLSGYPFFHQYGDIDPVAMRAICQTAVTETSLTQGQDVFQRGQASNRMLFVREGDLDYILQDMMYNDYIKATLYEGQWAAEACVWIKWFHTGHMKARHDAQIFELQVDQLHTVMMQYHELLLACQKYATLFWQRCKECDEPISDYDVMEFDTLQSYAQQAFEDTMDEVWDSEYSDDDDDNIVSRISSDFSKRVSDNTRLSWTSNVSAVGVSLSAAVAKKLKRLF